MKRKLAVIAIAMIVIIIKPAQSEPFPQYDIPKYCIKDAPMSSERNCELQYIFRNSAKTNWPKLNEDHQKECMAMFNEYSGLFSCTLAYANEK